jgi:hypothetical protein
VVKIIKNKKIKSFGIFIFVFFIIYNIWGVRSQSNSISDLLISNYPYIELNTSYPLSINYTEGHNLTIYIWKINYILIMGDSLSVNSESNFSNNWSYYMYRNNSYLQTKQYINIAHNQNLAKNMVDEYDLRVHHFKKTDKQSQDYLFVWGGRSDIIFLPNESAQEIYDNLKSIWRKGREDGFKVIAFTITPYFKNFPRGSVGENKRNELNKLITSNNSEYDFLVRPDILFPDSFNETFYNGGNDYVHLNKYAGKKLGLEVSKMINGSTKFINDVKLNSLNFNNSGKIYNFSLILSNIGDYKFQINDTDHNINLYEGFFLVRNPYYITIKNYIKDTNQSYINNNAYILAEHSNKESINYLSLKSYPNFHSEYLNGKSILKLYDPDQYYFSILDGEFLFSSNISTPKLLKFYGLNVLLGRYYFNGSNQTITSYIFSNDIQSKELFNRIFLVYFSITTILFFFSFIYYLKKKYFKNNDFK